MLVRISNKLRDPAWGFWEPKLENISLLTQNVKIVAHPTMFNYQVHFKNPAQIEKEIKIDLNIRPNQLSEEEYYKITECFEKN